ncbi:hypothetical protein YTPLAS18_12160 [Nitrospira sp.]|nr:hypothetical protein YTPLAS18_12160 [Nitrospira sp.]
MIDDAESLRDRPSLVHFPPVPLTVANRQKKKSTPITAGYGGCNRRVQSPAGKDDGPDRFHRVSCRARSESVAYHRMTGCNGVNKGGALSQNESKGKRQ